MLKTYARRIYRALDVLNDWLRDSWTGPYLTAAGLFWLLPFSGAVEFPAALAVLAALVWADPTLPFVGRREVDRDG